MGAGLGSGAHRRHVGGTTGLVYLATAHLGRTDRIVCQVTATSTPYQSLMAQVALRIDVQGIDAWFDLDAAELLGEDAENYEKVTDTLDIWFDSGVTHECVLRQRTGLNWPADLYLEGSDQHRGWFQSSLLTGIGTTAKRHTAAC